MNTARSNHERAPFRLFYSSENTSIYRYNITSVAHHLPPPVFSLATFIVSDLRSTFELLRVEAINISEMVLLIVYILFMIIFELKVLSSSPHSKQILPSIIIAPLKRHDIDKHYCKKLFGILTFHPCLI